MADVFLLTDRATMKTIMGIASSDTGRDTEIDLLIRDVSAAMAHYCGRADAIESKSRTKVFNVRPGQRVWQLPAYPISSITDVRLDFNRSFGSGTILDSESYSFDSETGLVTFDVPLIPSGSQKWANVVQFNWVGGLAGSLSALRSGYADIEHACQLQVQHVMKRKETDPGKFTAGTGGASRTYPAMDLLPYVMRTLDYYTTERLG